MPRWFASAILWSAPVLLLAGAIALVTFASAFRRGLGAHTTMTGFALLAVGVVLLLHGGYFAAPFLAPNHRALSIALTLPVAIIDTLILVTVWTRIEGGPTTHRTLALLVGLAMLVLWLPVAALIRSRLR